MLCPARLERLLRIDGVEGEKRVLGEAIELRLPRPLEHGIKQLPGTRPGREPHQRETPFESQDDTVLVGPGEGEVADEKRDPRPGRVLQQLAQDAVPVEVASLQLHGGLLERTGAALTLRGAPPRLDGLKKGLLHLLVVVELHVLPGAGDLLAGFVGGVDIHLPDLTQVLEELGDGVRECGETRHRGRGCGGEERRLHCVHGQQRLLLQRGIRLHVRREQSAQLVEVGDLRGAGPDVPVAFPPKRGARVCKRFEEDAARLGCGERRGKRDQRSAQGRRQTRVGRLVGGKRGRGKRVVPGGGLEQVLDGLVVLRGKSERSLGAPARPQLQEHLERGGAHRRLHRLRAGQGFGELMHFRGLRGQLRERPQELQLDELLPPGGEKLQQEREGLGSGYSPRNTDGCANDFRVGMAEKPRNPAEAPGIPNDAERLQGRDDDQRPGVEDIGAKDVERARIPAESTQDLVRREDGILVQVTG